MTKEELRNRGAKVPERKMSAAESIITTVNPTPEVPQVQPKEEKSKVGRPKGRPSTKISFNVPNEYVEQINVLAALHCNGNKSQYLTSLIEKDIAENQKVFAVMEEK